MQPKRKCKQLDKNISNLSKMKNESLEIGDNLSKKSLVEQNSILIYIIILLSGFIFFFALCTSSLCLSSFKETAGKLNLTSSSFARI